MSDNKSCCAPTCCDDDKQAQTSNGNSADQAVAENSLRETVREVYQTVARINEESNSEESNNNAPVASCCGADSDTNINALISTRLGYERADLDIVPDGADLGLGCGNPGAIAALKTGETVVDLGSGAGLDSFIASPVVGAAGRVIGIDMTADMISKARLNASKGKFNNVEFRLGEIEHLPVADNSVDVIISNCVINLSPDKAQVFREANRILKSGGRLAISDVVSTSELPDEIRNDPMLIAGCMGNTSLVDDLERDLQAAGFNQISIQVKEESREFIKDWAPGSGAENYVASATIEAVK